jgi:ankyrin repeat protein
MLFSSHSRVFGQTHFCYRSLTQECVSMTHIYTRLYTHIHARTHAYTYSPSPPPQAQGNADAVAKILETHPEAVNCRDMLGNTALHMAAHQDDYIMASLLINSGADPNARCKRECGGWTPLHTAAKLDHYRIGQLLIDKGCEVDALSEYKSTSLHEAAKHGFSNMLNLLLAHGANAALLDAEGFCPHLIAKKGEANAAGKG